MNNQDDQKKTGGSGLALKIKRVRTRLAASVKTGSLGTGQCNTRSDPTEMPNTDPAPMCTIGSKCFQ